MRGEVQIDGRPAGSFLRQSVLGRVALKGPVRTPVKRTVMRPVSYTVCRPVSETVMRECRYTVCRPVQETCYKEVCETVCVPRNEVRQVERCAGEWVEQTIFVPGKTVCCNGQLFQCPGTTCTKRVWCPRTVVENV